METLQIVLYPHPALRYPSRPVTRIDDAFRDTVKQMFQLMYEARGIGLAANQVGIPQRFFLLNLTADPEQPDQEQVFINPEILRREGLVEEEEGCLSFPDLYDKVRRSRKVRVKAFDLQGQPFEIDADELLSRAIQHESDHLAGKLFIDHFSPLQRAKVATKLRDIEREYRRRQTEGAYPDDTAIRLQLDEATKTVKSS